MNNQVVIRPSFASISPSADEVCAIMGYKPGAAPPYVPVLLESLMAEAPGNTSAAGCYRIFKLTGKGLSGGKVNIEGNTISCGSKICHQLEGADSVALFVATAGLSFDQWIKRNGTDGDIMSEYLAGSIGSVIADKTADIIQKDIEMKCLEEGKGITNRYSPGYCNWNIRDQQIIFDLLPVNEIGVSLTPSFLMNPVKSVSGIIGIGKGLQPGEYICDLCNLTDCLVKRAKEK